jgi:anti-anti-sigma factor
MLDVSTTDDGRLALRGELDLLCVPALEAVLAALEREPFEVDLSEVTFFDSSALRVFLNGRRRNPALRIANPSKAVLRVLDISGTADYLIHGRDINW